MPLDGHQPSENWVYCTAPYVAIARYRQLLVEDGPHHVSKDLLVTEVSELKLTARCELGVESLPFQAYNSLQALWAHDELPISIIINISLISHFRSFLTTIWLLTTGYDTARLAGF